MEDDRDPLAFGVTPSLFLKWRSPRFGDNNPTKVSSKVWEWLVRSKLTGYAATEKMQGPSPFGAGPTWCFERFGQSCNSLPDGRKLYIGGEHEDHYDPDFCIYNDVIVEDPDGHTEFYCYPRSSFLPTDFHTSTLVGDRVVIVGCLGYSGDRKIGYTPVYILDLHGFRIDRIDTYGDSPGWIHEHTAHLTDNDESIIIAGGMVYHGDQQSLRENIDEWQLNLQTWTWNRLTSKNWPRWGMLRKDRGQNHLWEFRQALWSKSVNWLEQYNEELVQLEIELGYTPDVDSIADLYKFSFQTGDLVEDADEHNLFWLYIDEVRVRFVEESYLVRVTVEGELPELMLKLIRKSLLDKLSALENCPCEIEEY